MNQFSTLVYFLILCFICSSSYAKDYEFAFKKTSDIISKNSKECITRKHLLKAKIVDDKDLGGYKLVIDVAPKKSFHGTDVAATSYENSPFLNYRLPHIKNSAK